MRKTAFIISLFIICTTTKAQTDNQYLMEVGAGVGLMSYEGDFNGSILKGMQPVGEVILRRNFNPYMGLKLTGGYGKIKGSSDDNATYYPEYDDNRYEFDNSLADVSIVYEYNFWPYGTGKDYRGAKRLTPFVQAGIGATYVTGGEKDVFTANIPLGLGLKYKIGERLNAGVEWVMHFSLSDKLDGVEDPYGIKSSGMFKNKDCYSALKITLTYSFMAKCKTCHNADE